MNGTNGKPKQRYVIIGLCVLLMASGIYVVGESLGAALNGEPEEGTVIRKAMPSRLAQEISGFEREDVALSYLKSATDGSRSLDLFHTLRAYPGGPPVIPHPVANVRTYGGAVCLTCHADGGYVPKFEAYAPVTPHPDLLNCRQCHNPALTEGLFDESTFEPMASPDLNQRALPGGPPAIPHSLQMRENCLACHAGPGAVAEIRTTHPERTNCRQCHALASDGSIWERPRGDRLP